MVVLYVQAFKASEANYYNIDLETLITVFLYKLCNTERVTLRIVLKEDVLASESLFLTNFAKINHSKIENDDVPNIAKFCSWPVVVDDNTVIAGLASVCRQIVKNSDDTKRKLLGFKEACLTACNEASIWTKFCEIDMICTVKRLLKDRRNLIGKNSIILPDDLTRFENHMEQPVKMHNVYKLARIKSNDKSIKSSVPVSELDLKHSFGEGPFMTLADLILFPCFQVIFKIFNRKLLENHLPLTLCWFDNMLSQDLITEFDFHIPDVDLEDSDEKNGFVNQLDLINKHLSEIDIIQEDVPKKSLYSSDPNRYKPQARIYTKQNEIEDILQFIKQSPLQILSSEKTFYHDIELDWSKIPVEARPSEGGLPKKREMRKTQQLENLAKATLKVVGTKSLSIVDFCSGSGHLGILVAALLPNCQIILVENKERSLRRAKERIEKMGLKNVTLLQCNLDYLQTNFDLGIALHACGVATDLVIETCIRNKANFICCPCCYGSIHNCHHLSYPRSLNFKAVQMRYKDFLVVSHSADQTHEEDNAKTLQGFFCMDVVDSDRKFYAEEHGYEVHLGKLDPPSCTPKNNLLIGVLKKQVD